jgi:hypothetical protein
VVRDGRPTCHGRFFYVATLVVDIIGTSAEMRLLARYIEFDFDAGADFNN